MALDSLKARWKQKTGEEMPEDIASQPLMIVAKAVRLCEAGFTVAVGKHVEPTVEVVEDSLMDWDRQDQKNGNAYGS